MQPEEVLMATAEIAVAFIGFTGLVAVLRPREMQLSSLDARRTWYMLLFAIALLIFALAPLPWLASGQSPWVWCSVMLAAVLGFQLIWSASFIFRDVAGVNPYFLSTLIIGAGASTASLICNALGIGFQQSFAGYFVGLLWPIIGSALFFSRLVYLRFIREADLPPRD